ncbi:MAG TPA: ABC transporter permease [Candidatus Sulfotelmatobacter sp.]|nr:ABC transporter permease [Candidatus Sulfotelmatobacter sp.]
MYTFQDLRFSIRTLRKSPGFALTALLTLGLGIGSVTAVFSVVNSVLLKPFAFRDPGRLVVVREVTRGRNEPPGPDNYKHYLNWQTNSKALAEAAIFRNRGYSVSADADHPSIVSGLEISPNFFSVLGVMPVLGRSFLPAETIEGRDQEVILSWSAWQKYFHGDPDAIGRTLRLGGIPQTVIGIAPQGFSFPHMSEMSTAVVQRAIQPYEIFKPLLPDMTDSGNYNYLVVGRLQAGVALAQAQSELDGLEQAYARTLPLKYVDTDVVVEPLMQEVAGQVSTALWLLLAAVGAVLLIGCVNLANLQLARAVIRERELSIRAALGAETGRLLWSALMDSLLLALVGGALGVLLSFTGVRLFMAAAPANLPRLNEVHVNWLALLAAAGLSIMTALLFGLLPALRSIRVDPQRAMQSSPTRIANTREGQRTRHLLVGGEVACTLVLLIVTGLLVRSFSHLLMRQRDFDTSHITLTGVSLFDPRYGNSPEEAGTVRASFIDRALADLGRLPGVESVAMTSEMPIAGETWVSNIIRSDHPLPPGEEPSANIRWVSPSYVSTLKIPLLAGRDLQPADQNHPTNVLISEQTARTAWPDGDPVGRTFEVGGETRYTVVGVVADARINDLKRTANMVFVPYWENPWWRAFFFIRSPQPTSALADSIRRTIWNIDPQVAIPTLKSLDDQVNDSVATERFQTILLSSFGIAALLLAVLGVYGVLAYSVSLRQQEFGIRVALGSDKTTLVRLVMRQAAIPVVGGILAGLALASGATRWIGSLLYETKTGDPTVIIASTTLLLVAAFVAALLPARRAASVDPMRALRTE